MYALNQGNQLEQLADGLIEQLSQPRQNPLTPPWVMVPHREMGHWLARRQAALSGISANVNFVQPSEAIWALLSAANPDISINNAFAPDHLTPRIFGLLSDLPDGSEFGPVKQYLKGKPSPVRMAFASRLAGIFDQYLVFRPQWLNQWEGSREGGWQGWIWRRLTAEKPWHWARALDWLQREPALDVARLNVPALHIFAQPTLSPGFFMAIRRFSECIPTHVYHWTPTEAYWPDVPSPRSKHSVSQEQEPYVSQLLASLGQPLKDTADQLFEWGPNEQDFFVSGLPDSLLGAVQRDLLSFDLDRTGAPVTPDGSLSVRRCTTRQREVEVCRDELQQMFDADPSLQPSDVLVICPDLSSYLPAIRAEFGSAGNAERWSWRVLGANTLKVFDSGTALLEALALLSTLPLNRRCLELLRFPAVQRRFRLSAAQADDVSRWVSSSGLFVDTEAGKFSWEAAYDRWVDALTLDRQASNVNVSDQVHLSEAASIGRLFDLLSTLQELADRLSTPRSLEDWRQTLEHVRRRLLNPQFDDLQSLTDVTASLARVIPQPDVVMDLAALTALLGQLRTGGSGGGGGPGGITVATPSAVRLLPARVIYVLGISDGEFPGPALVSELNKMDGAPPQKGDRARRLEDRLLLLEWLTSARQTLIFSGRSRNAVSAEPEALSSLMEELLTWCEGRYGLEREALAITPPLHGFSVNYGQDYVGYATHFNVRSPKDVARFVDQPLPRPSLDKLSLDHLCRFWMAPCKWFVEQVLGIWLDLPAGILPQLPPVAIDPLGRYQLLDQMTNNFGPHCQPELMADVALPDGRLGVALAEDMTEEAGNLYQRLLAIRGDGEAGSLAFEVVIDGIELGGTVDEIYAGHRVASTSGRLNAGRILDTWIRHLALCCMNPQSSSALVARDQSVVFGPIENPLLILSPLVRHFLSGQCEPLPFYPETSRQHAQGRSALTAFENDYGGGLSPHVAQAFRSVEPLGGQFSELANDIWQPALEGESDADF
ncbi:MAG: exodeoxyribonuclease V subunit gamma [Lysobacterales bacterium]